MTGSSPPAAVPLGQPADGAPPPGWYPDGVTPDSVRWFDGLRWTEHVRPASFGSDLGPSSAVHWLVPVGRSWQSITAGYLGLLGLVAPVLSPFAVLMGVLALRRARTGGRGRGRAWFAIVAGVLGCVWGVVLAQVLLELR